jgi:NADPH:quinone reductase-like Zn-dependent oxidoreductase
MAGIPKIQRAIVVKDNQAVLKTDQGIAPLRTDSLLIRTKAVALNPTDWKHALLFSRDCDGCVQGVDYAGIVEDVGEGPLSRHFKKGDRVAGSLHGCKLSKSVLWFGLR